MLPSRAGARSAPSEVVDRRIAAGRQLKLLLMERYLSGKFTAEDVTSIAWWHTESGGTGLEDYALPVSRQTGHAAKIDAAIAAEWPPPELYKVLGLAIRM